MNCSRISSGAPTARRIAAAGAVLLLLPLLVTFAGCDSSETKPTQAELTLRFFSEPAGASQGAAVYVDGAALTSSLAETELRIVLDAGDHTIVVWKDCAEITPAETLVVTLTAGQPATREIHVRQLSGLAVTSEPAGLPVLIGGEPSGLVTPASFGCMRPGTYDVRVSPSGAGRLGFALTGDTARTVVLGDDAEEVSFSLASAPRRQTRGMLFEIFTASECPNCPPADRVADELRAEPPYAGDDFALVHIHLYWNGTDPLFNNETGERASFYRINPAGAPVAFFNGDDKTEGILYPDLKQVYRTNIEETFRQDGAAGLYWSNARFDGDIVRASLRYVAIEDLSGYTLPTLCACMVKDSIRFVDPAHDPNNLQYIQGAREYVEPIDLAWEQKTSPGSVVDMEVAFDLGNETHPDYVDWPSGALRLVAFVQDFTSHEVLQCRQIGLNR